MRLSVTLQVDQNVNWLYKIKCIVLVTQDFLKEKKNMNSYWRKCNNVMICYNNNLRHIVYHIISASTENRNKRVLQQTKKNFSIVRIR